MKKTRNLLLVLAAVLAVLACIIVSSTVSHFSRRVPVVVVKSHLLPGSVISEADVETRMVHPADVPAGALTALAQAVGRRAQVERWPGDVLTADHLGDAQVFTLAPDEVAIAIAVDRVTGLSGLLRPGDRVSVIGVIASANLPTAMAMPVAGGEGGAPSPESPLPYAHIYLRGMRVLFIHHEFEYSPPQPAAETASGGLVPVSSSPTRQAESGVVVLAAPVEPQIVSVYVGTEQRIIFASPAEVVALLNSVARIHLALDPAERADTDVYGVRLSDLLPISSTVPIAPIPEVTP